MNYFELQEIKREAIKAGRHMLNLYKWSHSECQWAQNYQSIDGRWEWYFW